MKLLPGPKFYIKDTICMYFSLYAVKAVTRRDGDHLRGSSTCTLLFCSCSSCM